MEFCGRCGHQLGRELERGRFCPRCGHETPGNARYPLYADGTPAVTRQRPASVSQDDTAVTFIRPTPMTLTPAGATPTGATPTGAGAMSATAVRGAGALAAPVAPHDGPPATAPHAPTSVDDVTRRRMRSVGDAQPHAATPGSGWPAALAATLTVLALVVLLGLFLLLH